MTVAEHWVATTRRGARSLLQPRYAGWLWARLRHNFPDALSCVLMPDHVHLVALLGGHERLLRVLAAFTGLFGIAFDVLPVQPANTARIAARAIGYGYFNPVRDGLVDDPWAWRWSTLRELGGAAHPSWTRAAAVAEVLRVSPSRVVELLTHMPGHRPPTPRRTNITCASLEGLCAAVGAALRVPDDEVLSRFAARRLVVQAADSIGMPNVRALAKQLGCCERTVHRDRKLHHPGLDAVLLCLGDDRLRR